MPTIRMNLSPQSIDMAIQQVNAYREKVILAADEIAYRLSEIGFDVAYGILSGHVFSGETSESLNVEKVGDGQYILSAGSKAILFFEFGAGIRYGGGHPWDDELGFGPGTYPGNGHWDDPNGWWFPTDDPRLVFKRDKNGQGWGHSYGNKPNMPFYIADSEMRSKIIEVAKYVLQGVSE